MTSLSSTLVTLINRTAADGQPHTVTLPRGLIVQVHQQPTKFTLRCWRTNGQLAGENEWNTLFDYLPMSHKTVTRPTPVIVNDRGLSIYSASWPLPERLL